MVEKKEASVAIKIHAHTCATHRIADTSVVVLPVSDHECHCTIASVILIHQVIASTIVDRRSSRSGNNVFMTP